jgi:hypothetical protein
VTEVLVALALSSLAAALAITAVDAADHADLRLALSGLPGRVWAILPVLGPISAVVAASRWNRSGALVGWLASGWRPRRFVAGAAVAGAAASLVTLVGWEAAPSPRAPTAWVQHGTGSDRVWIGPDGRSASVREGELVGASVGDRAVSWGDDLAPATAPARPPAGWVAGPEAPVSALFSEPAGARRTAWLLERLAGPVSIAAWTALGAAGALARRSWLGVLGAAVAWRLADLTASTAVAQGQGGPVWLALPAFAALGFAWFAWRRTG